MHISHSVKRLVQVFGLIFAIALVAPATRADSTYTYTGNTYNIFFGSAACPPECGVSGSFTVSTSLLAGTEYSFTPLSFSITDGVETITQANATTSAFTVVTDSSGAIIGWNMEWLTTGYSIFSGTNPPGCVGCSVIDSSGDNSVSQGAQVKNDPGTWTSTTTGVPEPSSLSLLCLGILALVALSSKKAIA
jgi:hypothetical protein